MKRITTTRILACWLILCPTLCFAQNNDTDSLALVALYNATNGPNWTTTWNLNQPMDTWDGVFLNAERSVIDLSLYDKNLVGNIPSELGNLSNLIALDLGSNQLTGNIPIELGNLINLELLNLSDNQLSGCYNTNLSNLCIQVQPNNNDISNGNDFDATWEDFCATGAGDCRYYRTQDSLVLVDIYNSTDGPNWTSTWNLAQPIDTWYGVILNEEGRVISLLLSGNQLSGDIPSEIKNLSKLMNLNLSSNQLSGNIPPEIGNLNNLTDLGLRQNQLSGSIPSEIGNLNKLTNLNLSSNQLNGSIPPEIGNLNNLTSLNLSNNQLNGCYDVNLSNLCLQIEPNNNTYISNGNNFNATWEDFCATGAGDCTPYQPILESDSLALVALYHATDGPNWNIAWNFNHPVVTWQGVTVENAYVSRLVLKNKGLSGNIPATISDLDSLTHLDLADNNLTGNIPAFIGQLTNLKSLYLYSNQLSGSIPSSLGNLDKLHVLHLNDNQLSDTIPDSYGNLSSMRVMFLHSNQLSGSIPSTFGNMTNLEILHLNNNQLTGHIPPELGKLLQLNWVQLNNNQLSGHIPIEIKNINNMFILNLSKNQLNGVVPDFSNWVNLELDIQYNKFSHEDIAINHAANDTIGLNLGFRYSPQYHGEVQSHIVTLDTTLTLKLSTPLPGNNNQNVSYQWKKNDAKLVGSTDSVFTITNLQISDVGKYTLHMTDSTRIADLEVISEPIYVAIPGYDLYGQPVIYNQIMMQFDNEAEKIEYEEKYVRPIERPDLAATVVDSCDCNRLLYLWDFPDDSIALEVFLEVNTKREKLDTRRAKVDGGFNNIFNIGPIVSGEGWTWSGDYPESYPDSVVVFLLDSGVDTVHWNASPYLFDTATIDSCYDTLISSGFNYTDTLNTINGDFTDSQGHGTYGFRSIAEGLDDYMNLKVVPLKVFDNNGQGTLFDFVCALYHAIDNDADIIHVSAGYTGQASDILENAVALSKEKGCLLVTAVGNDGADIDSIPQYPAYYAKEFYKKGYDGNDSLVHYNNVISVASINLQDELSTFSNYGDSTVVMSAYGEDMSGYSHTGEKVSSSGSSVSAFYVTRELIAEIAKDKSRTYEQIWQDFEISRLEGCPATVDSTRTGKCLDITLNEIYGNFRVYLEGAYDTIEHKMRNDLNMIGLLPGQIPGDSIVSHDLATQPYNNIPPYYQGNESLPSNFQNYPHEVVDWVLVSLRTETAADTELNRTAAWLLDSGNILLLRPLLNDIHTAPDSVFVVIEHRNHLWTMSPQKIPINHNIITWDFTNQDGYRASTTTGQVELPSGVWAMLAGEGQQDGDINGSDKIIWQNDNGRFLLYMLGDYNLNGDTNGDDKGIWERNNGKFSGVPK